MYRCVSGDNGDTFEGVRSDAERWCAKEAGRANIVGTGDSRVGFIPDVLRETGTRERRDVSVGRTGFGVGVGAFRRARGRGVDACESPRESIMTHSEPLSVCNRFVGLESMSSSSGYWPGMGVAPRSNNRDTSTSSHVPDRPNSSFPEGVML
jgi:hypothetical protein